MSHSEKNGIGPSKEHPKVTPVPFGRVDVLGGLSLRSLSSRFTLSLSRGLSSPTTPSCTSPEPHFIARKQLAMASFASFVPPFETVSQRIHESLVAILSLQKAEIAPIVEYDACYTL
jgi:hypothetical protein